MNDALMQAITYGVLETYPCFCPRCHAFADMRLQDARNARPPSGPFGEVYMCLQCHALFSFDQAPRYLDEDAETSLVEELGNLLPLIHCPVSDEQRNTSHFQRMEAYYYAVIDPESKEDADA